MVGVVHRFIKAVGGGAKRSRDLTRDEGRVAMALIADGYALPVQLGAFLLALRMKGEGAEEMAGFVDALEARARHAVGPPGTLDVDCHGDGHAGHPTLMPAAACAAAALDLPVLLRADLDSPLAKHGLRAALTVLGLDRSRPLDPERAAEALFAQRIGVVDLPAYSPALKELVDLRPLFGRRTVAQTLMKLLDPLRAATRLVGVFHAPYLRSTAATLTALGAHSAVCVQALGGLPEAAPGKLIRVAYAGADRSPEPTTLDLRALAVDEPRPAPEKLGEQTESPDASLAAVQQNRAALAGEEPALTRAAAAAALLLHAGRGDDPLPAFALAREALASGDAKQVADRIARI
jgi:anthranilate phosphoribosyltransferase